MQTTHGTALRRLALGIALAGASAGTHASMGNIGTSYGIFPEDLATAQALSMFNSQVSANYYNPAALVKDERGELTQAIMHAEQELRAQRPNTDSDVVSNDPSQSVLLGMKTNVASLLQSGHPIHLGFIAGVEKYGKEMLAFGAEASETGQYMRYGREPLFLSLGAGTKIWRGISLGAASRITLDATATLNATSTLAGETEQEELSVEAEPNIRSILGLTLNWGDTFCPDSSCFLSGFESALSFRNSSASSTAVESNIIVKQTIPDPGLSLAVSTIDSYQPEIYAFGTQYKGDGWRAGFTVEKREWSGLEDELEADTIKDQEDASGSTSQKAEFQDTVVPRIGAEMDLFGPVKLLGGLAYEESPLTSSRTPKLNYIDNDRIIAGLGLSATYERTRFLRYPVRFDIGYQYQQLEERDFTIEDNDGNTQPVTADGEIHVVSGSVTLKF
ncbi:aromatic hydrocarbon degradation protein [Halovibrio salipaludis]|uniref:Aromatic hydrocarbon degradation protein n=1 Tax=Halovibrio salipaludis TaxID=2032626 RepID=A0A2A2F1Q0_9GAMM|nr:outer membrane protein transport protein [Halovibrio salipaludis]PAU78654.1 aromatic hydrocarbon degradation protein [Halovibrio salipaludis]